MLWQNMLSQEGGDGKYAKGKRSTFSNAQQLNQISLTEEEDTEVQGIFDRMKKKEEILLQVDTENVEEMVHVMPMNNVLREDVREQLFTRESLLEARLCTTKIVGRFQDL